MFKIRGMGDGIIALHLHKNAKLLSKRKPSLRDPPVVAHCGRFVMLHGMARVLGCANAVTGAS